jgi:hypothetical protein
MALYKDPKIKLGFLVAPSGRRTQSEGETLEFLLTTHFPDPGITQELAAPAAALPGRSSNWRLATRMVTYRRVEWAKVSLPLVKAQEWMAYSQLCCSRLGGWHSVTDQNVSCLPVDWLCSSHMATGKSGVCT